jgi:hypothetical protein
LANLGELYERSLERLVERARSLLGATAMFALGIALAGAVRSIQLRNLESHAKLLSPSVDQSWEPIESLYTRSFDLMDWYATEHSTPWSQAYFLISVNLIFMESALEKAGKEVETIRGSLKRVAVLGNHLHDYNSDIRLIAAAQRRGQTFEQLSRRELEALVRIFTFDFSKEEQATLDDTYKFVVVIEKVMGGRTEPPRLTEKSRELLGKFEQQLPWMSLRSELTFRDMRAFGKIDSTSPQFKSLATRISMLPGESISDVSERLRGIREKAERIREEAGVSLPFLGTEVSAGALLLTGAFANLFLASSFFSAVRRARGTWAQLTAVAANATSTFGAEVFSDIATGRRSILRVLQFLLLIGPVTMAALLFGRDTNDALSLIFAVIAGLATVVFAMRADRIVARLPAH